MTFAADRHVSLLGELVIGQQKATVFQAQKASIQLKPQFPFEVRQGPSTHSLFLSHPRHTPWKSVLKLSCIRRRIELESVRKADSTPYLIQQDVELLAYKSVGAVGSGALGTHSGTDSCLWIACEYQDCCSSCRGILDTDDQGEVEISSCSD